VIKFANFEFILRIRDPKIAKRGEERRINTAQNRFFFYNYLAKQKSPPIEYNLQKSPTRL